MSNPSPAHCLRFGSIPDREQCQDIADEIDGGIWLIESHRFIGSTWIDLWEQETGKQLREEWQATVSELRTAIEEAAVERDEAGGTVGAYGAVCDRLGLQAAHQRGSGILTSVAAAALAWITPDAHEGLMVAANALGTDTDTIATMAGALLGACDGVADPRSRSSTEITS